ncbi:MAG: tetratricopeptide repeat protein [Oscillatoriales cyanobacterium]|nr:MAG: tetratricopeptide repeat protein [Oscillatoriales cyanobacterium]TAE26948.1 MAG: tetratricopeptide repeat protein [Oscillatoriales cyanobacterium]
MNEQKAVTEFDKGNQLLQDGKVEDAIVAYCCAIELNPGNSWFHHHLGEALAKQGRFDEAVTAFCGAIELKPDFPWSHHHLGDALAQQQKWKQATEAFRKGIELNPQHFGTYCGLGQSLEKLGLLDEAIAAYRRASELNPEADSMHHALANALLKRTQSDLAQAMASYHQIIELNPDNVEAYHNLLQLQPDNSETWFQLAQAFVRQEQMEEAIAAYRRAVALNPSSGEAYHELGGSLARLHQWEEAIASYRRAIELNSKSFLSHLQLGKILANQGEVAGAIASYHRAIELNPKSVEVLEHLWAELSRQRQWEQAVDIYHQIIEANPDLALAHYHLGAAFTYLCRWEEATATYQQAIDLNLEYSFWPHQLLGSALAKQGKLNEAISAYQKGLDVKPNEWGYFDLGMVLAEQNRLDEALSCYQKAVEIEPNQVQAYSPLRDILTKAYHQLGIDEAEKGLLDHALANFHKAPQVPPSQGKVCEYLWNGLNQQGVLDEASPHCQTKIQREEAVTYFSHTSKYTLINMWALSATDKAIIEDAGLSLANLQLISQDNKALEEIYINSFAEKPQIKLAKKTARTIRRCITEIGYCQQSMVETAYIYSVCPATGTILRSEQSFVVDYNRGNWWPSPVQIYRFVGLQIFYLIVGNWIGAKFAIYFPKHELIIRLNLVESYISPEELVNKLKGYTVSLWKQFKFYIQHNNKKESVAVLGFFSNIAHYTWNDLTALQYLHEQDKLQKIDKFIVGAWEYFSIGEIFPEIPREKIIVVSDSRNLFQTILENNYFAFRVTDLFINEQLIARMKSAALKKCSQDQSFLQQLEKAKKHFPLVCVQIRGHLRIWLSQVEGIANIIKNLHSDFPNLGIVFDGWSRTETNNHNDEHMIEREKGVIEQILALMPSSIDTYNAIGCKTYEKIAWANAIDTYIAPAGSGLTFLIWIANKVGVVHGDSKYYHSDVKPDFSPEVRENLAPIVFVARNESAEEDNTPGIYSNYDCDWEAIYSEVFQIIKKLNDERE